MLSIFFYFLKSVLKHRLPFSIKWGVPHTEGTKWGVPHTEGTKWGVPHTHNFVKGGGMEEPWFLQCGALPRNK